jgi:hypothetical protein
MQLVRIYFSTEKYKRLAHHQASSTAVVLCSTFTKASRTLMKTGANLKLPGVRKRTLYKYI